MPSLCSSFVSISIFSVISLRVGAIFQNREISPEDVGLMHTKAFHQLGELYSDGVERERSEFIHDMSVIASGFCPNDEEECRSQAFFDIAKEFEYDIEDVREVVYPEDFDPQVRESIEQIFEVVHSIRERHIDDVLSDLRDIHENIESLEVAHGHENEKLLGLSVLSVAIESTTLWHGAVNDASHPLHPLIPPHRRRMQFSLGINYDLATVIEADVMGALQTGLSDIMASLSSPALLANLLFPAIGASSSAFFNTLSFGNVDDFYIGFDDDDAGQDDWGVDDGDDIYIDRDLDLGGSVVAAGCTILGINC